MAARTAPDPPAPVVLSFDVEEHHRIEAAYGLDIAAGLRGEYAVRMEAATRRILAQLADGGAVATFFIVGEIAESHPHLVRDIARAGHEVASHGHTHTRVGRFTPDEFRADLLASKRALEAASGREVRGFRAPTFSVGPGTAWAVDVLAECGFQYDSSVFPVRHDRYGVPAAPREPFAVGGPEQDLVELPPATWRVLGKNVPIAGGGYFRLFPLAALRAGVRQLQRAGHPSVLYFHPWEFDPTQPKLPLSPFSKWRTYVGVDKTTGRLAELIRLYAGRFTTAGEVADGLDAERLPRFRLAAPAARPAEVWAGTVTVSEPEPASTLRAWRGRGPRTAPSPAPAPRTAPAGSARPAGAAGS